LGSAFFAAGRFEEAAAEFRRACEWTPTMGQAFFNLALCADQARALKEANEMLDAGVARLQLGGEAHLKAGRLKEGGGGFRACSRRSRNAPAQSAWGTSTTPQAATKRQL